MGNTMGNSCTNLADVVTEDELKSCAAAIDAWEKAREADAAGATGGKVKMITLLKRIGGEKGMKEVVETFYRKIYSNERLRHFLKDKDVSLLRSKQAAFMNWLFGPPTATYNGRSVRCAHLRMIKQRGFAEEDFLLGMSYFEESMRDYGAPQRLINEVMGKILPFKDIVFTPSAADAAEEARWAEQDRQQAAQEKQERAAKEAKKAQAAANKAAGLHSGSSSGSLSKSPSGAVSALQLQPAASPSRPTSSASPGARALLCPFAGSQQLRSSVTGSPRPGSASRCPFAAAFAGTAPAVAVAEATGVPHLTPRAIEAVIVDEDASPFAAEADNGNADSSFTAPLPTPSRLGRHASAPGAAELAAAGAATINSRGGSLNSAAHLVANCISAPLVQMQMPVSAADAAAAAANVRRLASRRATGSISSGACAVPEPGDLSLPGGVSEAVACQLAGASWNSHCSGGAGGAGGMDGTADDLGAEVHAAPSPRRQSLDAGAAASRRQSLDAGTSVSRRQSLDKQVQSPRASQGVVAASSSRLRVA
ncbi:hypothetical protein HXX76_003451 [Chlamydomonas incerta]|uniref:Globin-like protein n=1 Tax=Chlamydomonas incerta TaxID=51695 RepID=A0A835TEE8_CHLIN|nr:hypothetical protein HXX76_003451 [Chlamydomonas incerta]|eukprot:KAG2441843.1 hypothetical protein HXX76_003451 [Chlamydomonas incerta]